MLNSRIEAECDAAASRMIARMEVERREMEAQIGPMLCAACDAPAARRSCYCDKCEAEFSGD